MYHGVIVATQIFEKTWHADGLNPWMTEEKTEETSRFTAPQVSSRHGARVPHQLFIEIRVNVSPMQGPSPAHNGLVPMSVTCENEAIECS